MPSVPANACASVDLPTPGMSSISRWPRASRQASASLSGVCLPTTMRPSCPTTDASRSETGTAWVFAGRRLIDPKREQERCHYRGQRSSSHHHSRRATLRSTARSTVLRTAQHPRIFGIVPVPTAFITHPTCHMHDMGPFHPECPARLDAINDRLISDGLDAFLVHHAAVPATREQLERVHPPRYVDEIEAASPESGIHYVDPDTALNSHSLTAARHAAGAVVLATDLVAKGECRAAFCAVRPPGHHAMRDRAMGFCLFNNIAVGVAHALAQGLERAAVIDFDVHHGNG